MPKNKQQIDYAAELQKSHQRWQYLHEFGGSDPFWPDGVNLNLVRNHILYYRGKIQETFVSENYPEIYYRDVPQVMDQEYMARTDEIRKAAKETLELYKMNPDYQYIIRHKDDFTKKTQDKLYIPAILGYVSSLKSAIDSDDLVTMRRYETPERYLDSFTSCVERMQNQPDEDVQMSLFYFSESRLDDYESDEDEDFNLTM